MENLETKNLTEKELIYTNGGSALIGVAIGMYLEDVIVNFEDHVEAFKEGYRKA